MGRPNKGVYAGSERARGQRTLVLVSARVLADGLVDFGVEARLKLGTALAVDLLSDQAFAMATSPARVRAKRAPTQNPHRLATQTNNDTHIRASKQPQRHTNTLTYKKTDGEQHRFI